MKIVIDIPEKTYKQLGFLNEQGFGTIIDEAVANGTPLPKGHGKLINADSLIKTIEEKAKRLSNADTINGLCGAVALIYDEQAIIEADKESD